MFYDRQIKYLDLYDKEEKVQNAGFIRLEAREDKVNLQLRAEKLRHTDSGKVQVMLAGENREAVLGELVLERGKGVLECRGLLLQDMAGGIGYEELYDIYLKLPGERMLKCIVQERNTVQGEVSESDWEMESQEIDINMKLIKTADAEVVSEALILQAPMQESESMMEQMPTIMPQPERNIDLQQALNYSQEPVPQPEKGSEPWPDTSWTPEQAFHSGQEPMPQPDMQSAPQEPMPQPNMQAAPQRPTPQPNMQAAPQGPTPQPNMQAAPQGPTPQPNMQAAPQGPTPQPNMQATPQGSMPQPNMQAVPQGPTLQPNMQAAPQGSTPQPNMQAAPQEPMPRFDMQAAPQGPTPQPNMQAAPQEPMPRFDMQAAPQEPMPRPDTQSAPQGPTLQPNMQAAPQCRNNSEPGPVLRPMSMAPVRERPGAITKWQQLSNIYPHIRPFEDGRDYLKMKPEDFVILTKKYYPLANNSFLKHGYYNYEHLILTREMCKDGEHFYIGVPGNFYEKEKQVAVLFGFESFEGKAEPAGSGDFGYYMISVEI